MLTNYGTLLIEEILFVDYISNVQRNLKIVNTINISHSLRNIIAKECNDIDKTRD